MQLSKSNIKNILPQPGLLLPTQRELELPEKVLQFGTGVLLRGLPDHFITVANAQGVFNGRIVVVKSTATGDTDAFEKQDGLYTLCVRGVEAGEKIAFNQVISSISRVLAASADWDEVLQCAANPDMEIIISNTTEVGISMEKDNVHASPPQSFPGKLLAFLYHRYKIFNGAEDKGMVIVPTELIPGNAD
ncbi:MAG: altronate oxidoreductase, partial [Sphingobacteriales bacterium]